MLDAVVREFLRVVLSRENRLRVARVWKAALPRSSDGARGSYAIMLKGMFEIPRLSIHSDFVELFPSCPSLRCPRLVLDGDARYKVIQLEESIAFERKSLDLSRQKMASGFRGDSALRQLFDPVPLMHTFISVALENSIDTEYFSEMLDLVGSAIQSTLVGGDDAPPDRTRIDRLENNLQDAELEVAMLEEEEKERNSSARIKGAEGEKERKSSARIKGAEGEKEKKFGLDSERATMDRERWWRGQCKMFESDLELVKGDYDEKVRVHGLRLFLRRALGELKSKDVREKLRADLKSL